MSDQETTSYLRRLHYKNLHDPEHLTVRGTPRKIARGCYPELRGLAANSAAYRTAYTRIWRAAHKAQMP